jgi:O-antigen/teichoic acid export membrane protein
MYFSVLVVLGGILNGSEILNLVFGEDYASGNSIFMILTLSSFLAIWNVVLGAMMQAKGFQDKIMKLTGFVAGLNILLSFPFILLSGGKGAALAGFISELFIFIAYSLTISKFLTIKFNRPTISQILLVTLLIAGQIFSKVLEINVLLIIGFYGLVFLWLLKLKSGLLLLREKENVYGRT